ncbi:phosphotransferase family protein [Xanthobacter autotrophicus NCIMB 11399]
MQESVAIPPEVIVPHTAGFDPARLEAFLRGRLPAEGPGFGMEAVGGGQSNPTFFLTLGERRLVLRKRPPGPLLPSAHAIDREFRVQSALKGTGVPVPEPLLYCADESVVGTAFYVMERVDGRIFHDSALPGVSHAERAAMYDSLADVLGRLHRVDHRAVGLEGYGRDGDYFARQISRWTRQWEMSRTRDLPDVNVLITWLAAHVNRPSEEAARTGIVHGDFRFGNVIFHPAEPRIVAVLDWELSTLGHPLADLAHTCVYSWLFKPDEYGGGVMGLDLAALGIPSLDAFVARYGAATGSEVRLDPFHLAFALFRNAVIFEGIAARARGGNASAANAREIGALAPVFARRAVEIIEGRCLV